MLADAPFGNVQLCSSSLEAEGGLRTGELIVANDNLTGSAPLLIQTVARDSASKSRQLIGTFAEMTVFEDLISLLALEESVTADAYRSGPGAEDKYGEDYVEYTTQLTETVADEFKHFHDPAALNPLLHSAYNPDSIFAKWLGEQGSRILPTTREMLRSDLYPDRESAVAVVSHLIEAARLAKVSLSPDQVKEAHNQLLEAAANPDMNTRAVAAQYLGRVGTKDDIPLLERLSLSDPGFDKVVSKYVVRDAAVKALGQLKQQR